ncbi:MAG TPA: pseudaminic acid synthase [Pseudolabrys sp.]|jgi:N-acetylneuraminate synthase|nr:pseudaminic acid synthase [Pseudolabrys sp.]
MTWNAEIAGRPIGLGHPPYVIAELSGNHNGRLERALQLIDAAKGAGADAVKLQTYTADTITIDHDGPGFTIEGGLWSGRRLHELYREAHTPWEWHPALFEHSRKIGIACFSSPFDATAVDLLEKLGAPAYKIASFEIVDLPLVRYAAKTGKPLIISTGMAAADEIAEAVGAAREAGAGGIVLLHCVSGYPTPADEANLARIQALAADHDCPIGLSDHTLCTDVAVAATALGAAVVEKHVTLARADGGPDAAFSLEPHELAALVQGVRTAHAALGRADYGRAASEQPNMVLRRSLYAVRDIAAGEVLTAESVRSIRPGYGLAPKHLSKVLGRRARRAIARGTPMSFELVE